MNTNKKLELIEEVKKRPVLYDKNHIHFHDFNKKDHLWNWLSRKFNINAKKKWGTLRDKYVRLKRESELYSDSREVAEKWDLYESLAFLNNYCRHRKSLTTVLKPESLTPSNPSNHEFEFAIVSNNDAQHLSTEESQELIENNYVIESISNHSGYSESPAKRIKSDLSENEKNNTTEDMANSKNYNLKLSDDTENMIFMKMIGKKLELLPSKDKNRIQIEILQLVNEELDKSDTEK